MANPLSSKTPTSPLLRLNLILTGVLLIAVIVILGLTLDKRSQVAYVKVGELLDKYQGMVDARAQYQQKEKTWKANVDTLGQELEQMVKDYEKKSGGMTVRERQLTEQLLETRQNEFVRFRDAMQQKAREEDTKMTEAVVNKVNAYLKEYGEDAGYDLILGATSGGNILYGIDGIDITQDVLKGLNATYTAPQPANG
jgi:outer membrane protein